MKNKEEFEQKRDELLNIFLQDMMYLYVAYEKLSVNETLAAYVDVVPFDNLDSFKYDNEYVIFPFSDN
jgi:hypothetical protein